MLNLRFFSTFCQQNRPFSKFPADRFDWYIPSLIRCATERESVTCNVYDVVGFFYSLPLPHERHCRGFIVRFNI